MTADVAEEFGFRMRLDQLRARTRLPNPLNLETRRAQPVDVILETIGEIENRERRGVFETPLLGIRLVGPIVRHLARDRTALRVAYPGRILGHEAWMKHAEVKSASGTQNPPSLARDAGKIRRVHQRHGRD